MHQHLLRPALSHHAPEQDSLFCGDGIPAVGGQAVYDLRTNEGHRGRDLNSRLAKLSRSSKPMVMSCSLRCLNPVESQAVGVRDSNSQGPSRKWEGVGGGAALPTYDSQKPHPTPLPACNAAPTPQGKARCSLSKTGKASSVAVPPPASNDPAEPSLPEISSPRAGDVSCSIFHIPFTC